jgi:hypothetical protein
MSSQNEYSENRTISDMDTAGTRINPFFCYISPKVLDLCQGRLFPHFKNNNDLRLNTRCC